MYLFHLLVCQYVFRIMVKPTMGCQSVSKATINFRGGPLTQSWNIFGPIAGMCSCGWVRPRRYVTRGAVLRCWCSSDFIESCVRGLKELYLFVTCSLPMVDEWPQQVFCKSRVMIARTYVPLSFKINYPACRNCYDKDTDYLVQYWNFFKLK